MNRLSDRGSIPLSSIKKKYHSLFLRNGTSFYFLNHFSCINFINLITDLPRQNFVMCNKKIRCVILLLIFF